MKEGGSFRKSEGGKEEDEDFRSENSLIISFLVVELFSKIRFRAVVVAGTLCYEWSLFKWSCFDSLVSFLSEQYLLLGRVQNLYKSCYYWPCSLVTCPHTSLKCVSCTSPHEAHSAQCLERPAPEPREEGGVDDEMH